MSPLSGRAGAKGGTGVLKFPNPGFCVFDLDRNIPAAYIAPNP